MRRCFEYRRRFCRRPARYGSLDAPSSTAKQARTPAATAASEDSGLKEFAAVPDKSSDHTHSGSLDQSNPVGSPLVQKLTSSPIPGATPEIEAEKINQSIETSVTPSLEEGPLPAILAALHIVEPLPLVGETWPASDLHRAPTSLAFRWRVSGPSNAATACERGSIASGHGRGDTRCRANG